MARSEKGRAGGDEPNLLATTQPMNTRATIRISAVVGFLAVALGAFGAHGLKTTLEANNQLPNWNTAAHYHLIHAVAMLAVALHAPARKCAWWLWLGGIILFSGSLYVIGLTNLRILGAFVTPVGGVLLMAGWLALLAPPKNAPAAE
jgi:uncharacterized membrane protein YgdD (TMEM256/DUF423 family)